MWIEPPPLSSHCPVRGVLMVRTDHKIWVQANGSSVLTCCCSNLWLTVVLASSPSATNLTSSSSPRKRVRCLFQLGCQFAYSIPPWLSKFAYQLSLECLWPLLTQYSHPNWPPREPSYQRGRLSGGPPWCTWLLLLPSATAHAIQPPLSDYHENHLILVDLSLVVPLGLPLAATHAVQPPRLTTMRTILPK
jgi:hypothetical protein